MTARDWLARAALMLAVGGALAVGLEALPRDHSVVFQARGGRFERLEASWTAAGESEPRGGVSLRPGPRPRDRLNHTIRAPNGDYVIEVTAMLVPDPWDGPPDVGANASSPTEPLRAPSPLETSVTRRVTLEGGETVISIRVPSRIP